MDSDSESLPGRFRERSPFGMRRYRCIFAVATLAIWYGATMGTVSGTWENHPFAGPFILLKMSWGSGWVFFPLLLLAGILGPGAYWVVSAKIWPAVVAILVTLLSVWLSFMAAVSASVWTLL